MKITDIDKFEKLNNQISINVFEYSKEDDNDYNLVPLYISKTVENRRIIDIILFKNHHILLKNYMYLLENTIIVLFVEIA